MYTHAAADCSLAYFSDYTSQVVCTLTTVEIISVTIQKSNVFSFVKCIHQATGNCIVINCNIFCCIKYIASYVVIARLLIKTKNSSKYSGIV